MDFGEDEMGKRLIKVANNIFEKSRGYVKFGYETDKYQKFYSKLYRNYNEDFWRMRENDNV
ncbi:MAG: hypothetical protein ACI86M_000384 [Saprospiraceae bacterium]